MLNFRSALILVVALMLVSSIQAAQLEQSDLTAGQFAVRDNPQPLAPQSITQSTDPNMIVALLA